MLTPPPSRAAASFLFHTPCVPWQRIQCIPARHVSPFRGEAHALLPSHDHIPFSRFSLYTNSPWCPGAIFVWYSFLLPCALHAAAPAAAASANTGAPASQSATCHSYAQCQSLTFFSTHNYKPLEIFACPPSPQTFPRGAPVCCPQPSLPLACSAPLTRHRVTPPHRMLATESLCSSDPFERPVPPVHP